MYDFIKFTEDELRECGTTLQTLGSEASSMEDSANKIVTYLYDNITDSATGQRSCAWYGSTRPTPTINSTLDYRALLKGFLAPHPLRTISTA